MGCITVGGRALEQPWVQRSVCECVEGDWGETCGGWKWSGRERDDREENFFYINVN